MTNNFNTYLFTFIGLPFFLLLTACQSPINQAQKEHKSTVDKWQALMQYGESTLPDYGISISAQLSLRPRKKGSSPLSYQLTNIQLNDKNPLNHINLLSPWFTNKYICSPVCTQLTEYKSKTNIGSTTLLNYYFEQYQYQFYDFYVQVYQVNKQLVQLNKIQPLLVKDYLLHLADKQAPQTSLADFIKLLTQSLTPLAYQEYLLQPQLRVGEYQPSNEGLPSIPNYEQGTKEQNNWQNATVIKTETIAWQKIATSNAEILKWQKVASINNVQDSPIIETQATEPLIIPSITQWLSNKNNNLSIGDLACSYQYNMFGKVIAIHPMQMDNSSSGNKGTTVTISLFGQAKKVRDGVMKNQEDGYLFNTSQHAVSFKPIKGVKTFLAENVSQCIFE